MSIKAMSYVWDHSSERGSRLLMLLAIADFADDYGMAYPGITRLAEKTRMSERNAQLTVRALAESGQLAIETNDGIETGHGKTNRYHMTGYQRWMEAGSPPPSRRQLKAQKDGVKPASPLGVKPASPKPSVEPSEKDSAATGALPPPRKLRQPDPYMDAVMVAWKETNGGVAANYVGMLFGTKKVRGEWNTHRITPVMTLEEFAEFVPFARKKMESAQQGDKMPTGVDTLARYVTEFRAEKSAPVRTAGTILGIKESLPPIFVGGGE